ncbi:MAG: efflux RND transporter permease subunit [Porticoccaceae bacterium]
MTEGAGNQNHNDLASLSIRRPVLVCVVALLIILAGLAAMLGVEIRELPNVDRPTVTITADYSGASPETVDAEVTSVLEGAASRVSGVKSINSQSEEGNARVRIEFYPDVEINDAASDIREAVSRASRQPSGCGRRCPCRQGRCRCQPDHAYGSGQQPPDRRRTCQYR